jgi:hypothetical protein
MSVPISATMTSAVRLATPVMLAASTTPAANFRTRVPGPRRFPYGRGVLPTATRSSKVIVFGVATEHWAGPCALGQLVLGDGACRPPGAASAR